MFAYETPGGVYTAVDESIIPSEYPRAKLLNEPSSPPAGYHWGIDWANSEIVNVRDAEPVVTNEELSKKVEDLTATKAEKSDVSAIWDTMAQAYSEGVENA